MSMTRTQLRTRTMRRADATTVDAGTSYSPRWNTTAGATGEVDQIMGFVQQREWKRILNANRFYRINKVQPAVGSDGRIAITALSTGTGDTKKNFYRIMLFVRNNYIYSEVPLERWATGEASGDASRVWWREGTDIMFLPKETSVTLNGTGDGIWVNWTPTRVEDLSADSITVEFPDGYEEILALEGAALLLSKGSVETAEARELRALAEEFRQDMLQDIARTSTNPLRMQYEDSSFAWGGE